MFPLQEAHRRPSGLLALRAAAALSLVALLLPVGVTAKSTLMLSLQILERDLLAAGEGTLAFWRGPSPLQRPALRS